jgi:hypothetical protein
MPSFSRPKGVRTLTSNDWFYAARAAGSGQLAQLAGNDSQISLYNNANAGVWLFVYAFTVLTNFGSNSYYFTAEGSIGTLSGTCYPAVCDGPLPFGQIFTNYTPTPGSYNNKPFVTAFQSNPSLNLGGAIAVLKPGYSLVVQNSADQIVSFDFLAVGP